MSKTIAVLICLAIGFSVWVYFIASCNQLRFLPITSIPSKCVEPLKQP
jgi:hypothetical protein